MEHETLHGNNFTVTLRFWADLMEACTSDDVARTINYGRCRSGEEEMSIPSKLLENVAYRIIKRVEEAFPKMQRIEVELAKMNPPVAGKWIIRQSR